MTNQKEIPAYMYIRHYKQSGREPIISAIGAGDLIWESAAGYTVDETVEQFISLLRHFGIDDVNNLRTLLVWRAPEYLTHVL